MKKILSVFLVTVLCSQACLGSAEYYLRKLTTKGKISSTIISIPLIAGGCHIYNLGEDISQGINYHPHDTVVRTFNWDVVKLKTLGGALSSVGVLLLLSPNSAGRELKKIKKIRNPKERESASRSAVAKLAKKGKIARHIYGGIFTFLSLNSYYALIGSVLCFTLKSPAEKYLERLQLENFLSTENNKIVDPQLYFAFNPYNNLYSVNLQMKF